MGEPRRYYMEPRIGQIIQEYPKHVYDKEGKYFKVENEEEHRDLLESWGEDTSKGVSSWVVYHFHDTSETAAVRLPGQFNDNEFLRPNAENLAAFLYHVRETAPTSYQKIRDVVTAGLKNGSFATGREERGLQGRGGEAN